MIRKTLNATETKVLDPARGLVEAMFAITANVDRQNDRILPGAFTKALAAKTSVPVVYQHKWDDLDAVLGKTLSWSELMPGSSSLPDSLRAKGLGGVKTLVQFELGVPSGQIAFVHVRNKNLTEWSWAFDVADSDYDASGVRNIKSVSEIFEVTLSLVGANPETLTMALTKSVAMQREQKERWERTKRYIAEQLVREESSKREKAEPIPSPILRRRLTVGEIGYFESLEARKRAAFKAQQDHFAEVRRKMGLPPHAG